MFRIVLRRDAVEGVVEIELLRNAVEIETVGDDGGAVAAPHPALREIAGNAQRLRGRPHQRIEPQRQRAFLIVAGIVLAGRSEFSVVEEAEGAVEQDHIVRRVHAVEDSREPFERAAEELVIAILEVAVEHRRPHRTSPRQLTQFPAPIDPRSVASTPGVTSASDRKIACPRATSTKVNGTPLRLIESLMNSGSLDAASKPARSAASAAAGVPRGAKPA